MELTLQYQGQTRALPGELSLAAAQVPSPGAFSAIIARPQTFRAALLALGEVVKANDEYLDREEWLSKVLDPVVGIHPDGVSFEAFSQDCSTLGWVHFGNTVFEPPDLCRGGCTNIDYTEKFESCLRGLTPLSRVRLTIGSAEGVALDVAGAAHHEKKIDLPEGWLRGFGELHAGLLQAGLTIPLTKPDLFNIMRATARKAPAAMKGRALIFELRPGERTVVRVQPWDAVIRLQAPPPEIDEPLEVKVYGRRRLQLLTTLIPHVESARVYLSGSARPTYWELALPGARMILAMSSWTSRKFTQSFAESLRGAAAPADDAMVRRAAAFLADAELASLDELAEELSVTVEEAKGFGLALCRQGLAVAEPQARALRWRPLQYLPFAELSAAAGLSSRERNAALLLAEGRLEVLSIAEREGLRLASGRCQGSAGLYDLSLTLNPDGSFAAAACTCKWMTNNQNDLKGGPCKHLLALRAEVLNPALEGYKHA